MKEIPDLDRRGLRQFGLVTGCIVAGLFGFALPWLLGREWPMWPWALLLVLGALAITAPMSLQIVYRRWMQFGMLASRITTPLILSTVFFLVISPMALLFRLIRRDALSRRFDATATTYRVMSKVRSASDLERPF